MTLFCLMKMYFVFKGFESRNEEKCDCVKKFRFFKKEKYTITFLVVMCVFKKNVFNFSMNTYKFLIKQ